MDISSMHDTDLKELREQITDELVKRSQRKLEEATQGYVGSLGKKEGMERLGDWLLRSEAQKHYPDGWPGYIAYLNKISG